MSSKKLPVFLAEQSLEFTRIVGGQHDETHLQLSGSINLCIQFAKLSSNQRLPLTANQLLYCCDVLNGGAVLTKFDTPDSVSIESSLENMLVSLISSISNDVCSTIPDDLDSLLKKWSIEDAKDFIKRLETISRNLSLAWTLAISTRHFWSRETFDDKKLLNECQSYTEWAVQWIAE